MEKLLPIAPRRRTKEEAVVATAAASLLSPGTPALRLSQIIPALRGHVDLVGTLAQDRPVGRPHAVREPDASQS